MYCSNTNNEDEEAETSKKHCTNTKAGPKCESNNLEKSIIDPKYSNILIQAKCDFPWQTVKFFYTITLSVFCLLKKYVLKSKYKGIILTFEDNEIENFSNIVIRFNEKSTHVCVIYLNKTYFSQSISYANLFGKKPNLFSINNFFNSYAKYMFTKSHASSYKPKHLVIYSNVGLEITKNQKLKEGRSRDYYPFEFVIVDVEKYCILNDFLSVNDHKVDNNHFYQFLFSEQNKNEFIKRLEYSKPMKNLIKTQNVPKEYHEKLKETFFRKLVFVCYQPQREELKIINDYNVNRYNINQNIKPMQDVVLKSSDMLKNNPNFCNFELLVSLTIDMFMENKVFAINLVEYEKKTVIKLHHRDKVSYIINLDAFTSLISYKNLFLSEKEESKKKVSLNSLFSFFNSEYENNPNIKFFVIYTNSDLGIDEYINKTVEDGISSTNPFNLNKIDIEKKRYKLFKRSFTFDNKKIYRFPLKNYPFFLQWIHNDDESQEMKELFLHKVIIANNQSSAVKNEFGTEISKVDIPHNYESLQEAILRWAEFYSTEPISQRLMRILLNDIKEKRSSGILYCNQDVSEEIKFVKQSIHSSGTYYCQLFLHFLVKGKGKKYFADCKKKGLSFSSIAGMIGSTTGKYAVEAFTKLHNLWFDENGKLKMYLKVLHKNCYKLSEISSLLEGTKINAAEVFKDIYHLLFTEDGKKTKYLSYLEKEQVRLSCLSSIIRGAGCNIKRAYIDLFNLWFDEHGNKTELLKNLEVHKIRLPQLSNIMLGSGSEGPDTFKKLYDLLFDSEGNASKYLSSLLDRNINFSTISTVLSGSAKNSVSLYKSFYHTLFDVEGKPKIYLERLESNGISLTSISKIMFGTRFDFPTAFKNYYHIWFDEDGNETKYLKAFKNEVINMDEIGDILTGSSFSAPKVFKDLYDIFFDDQGCKKEPLKYLEKNNIRFKLLSLILRRSGLRAITAFTNLFKLWFDENGNKTFYITNLENNGINLLSVLQTIKHTNIFAAEHFLSFYNLWFDENGEETHYLIVLKRHIDFNLMAKIIQTSNDPSDTMKNLIDLWFDEQGEKTKYLYDFETEGISLHTLYHVFFSAHIDGSFKKFHRTWFKKNGGKRSKLKMLEDNKVNLQLICGILYKCRGRPVEYFNNLYAYWFDEQGEETHYVQNLKSIGIELDTICHLLEKSSVKAIEKFTRWYRIFFDDDGNKTALLITIINAGIDLKSMCHIFIGYGGTMNKDESFKKLFECWYDEQGQKTRYTEVLEKNQISLNDICKILKGAGRAKAVESFIGFYDLLFDQEGNPTKNLQHFRDSNFHVNVLLTVLHDSGSSVTTNFKNWHTACINKFGNKKKSMATLEKHGINLLQIKNVVVVNQTRDLNKTLNLLLKVWFDKTGNKTPKLNALENLGLSLTDIFEILKKTGKDAPDVFINLYDLFYNLQGEMSMYARTLRKNNIQLSSFFQSLLENPGSQIIEAFKNRFTLCFDEEGNAMSAFLDKDVP